MGLMPMEKQQDAAKSKGGGRSMLMQVIADADRR